MCGLFPCIPTFKGFIFLKKLVQVGNLNVCVKLIGWLAAIDTTRIAKDGESLRLQLK